MSSYENKNNTLTKFGSNIRVSNTPMEQYVTEGELVKGLATKQDILQYDVLPTASAENLGKIVQYIGTTTVNYTNGYFYKCGLVDNNYVWVVISDLPSGGTTGQVLVKSSDADYDTEWGTVEGGSDNPYKGKNVVHMGDSWVHIYGIAEDAAEKVGYNVTVCGFQATSISDYNTPFSDALEFTLIRLATALGNNDWTAQDAALAGSDLRGYRAPLARLKAVDWSNTDVLVLSYGVNDYGVQNPLGDAFARDEESVSGALLSAINILQGLNSNMEIIVTTPCYRYISPDDGIITDFSSLMNILDKYRKAIALTAKTCAVKLIDMFAISGINEGNHALTLLSDGLHPTTLGVDKWGTAFAHSIECGYTGAIDTNNTFAFGADNLCFDSEKLDVHEKWNGSYTSGGIKYICTRRAQIYGHCILGMKHYDSLPAGTVIALSGYGKKIGDTNHRLGFYIKDAALASDLLDKYATSVNSTTDSAISYSFTTLEEYTDCWVVFYVKQMSRWDDGKALVRDMKCTVTLPS